MTTAPAGMAPVFHGWNVWDVWQASDPDENILGKIWHAGISPDQLLRLWVENQIEDNAPGANVSDPLNPSPEHFRGDEVQIIGKPSGLEVAAARESAGLGDALQVGNEGSEALFRSVRFYNRGGETVMPWPRDKNFVVDAVYTPSATNPLTNAPAPTTAGAALGSAGDSLAHALTALAWVGGAVGALFVLSKLQRGR